MKQNNTFKPSFFGAAFGTLIEYYDYVLFVTFLPILSPLFFPGKSALDSLVKGYLILFLTLLARPLGGLCFGFIGDFFGRRKALLGSMYGIALSTLLIGITPSIETIGISALVIVVIAKAVQLFCFGGEYNGAGIYVVEHAPKNSEGLSGGALSAMTLLGSLLASLIGVGLTSSGMPVWSWRIAFILGALIGVFGILYRKKLLESPNFLKANLKQHGLGELIQRYPYELTAGFFMGGFATVPFTTVFTFINPILMTEGYFTPHQLMLIESFLLVFAIATLLIAGKLADKKSPLAIMKIGCYALIFFSYPLMKLINPQNLYTLLAAEAAFIIINEIFLGPSNAYLKNSFAMHYRYRGSSLSFGLGMSVLGGVTPLVENYLYHLTGDMKTIFLWLCLIGIGALASLNRASKRLALKPLYVSES